jgi:uncharacterized membrane protein
LPSRGRSLARAYTNCQQLCARDRGRVVDLDQVQHRSETVPPLREATSSWKRWRRMFHWDARAAEYDTFLEEQTREGLLDALREMNTRHAAIAKAATEKLVERLHTLKADELSPAHLIIWLEKAAQVERLARSTLPSMVATEVATRTVEPDLSLLTVEELEQMRTILERAEARKAM